MRLLTTLLLLVLASAPVAAEPAIHLIYQPVRSMEIQDGEIRCEADSFLYRFERVTGEWNVEKRRKPHEFRPAGTGDDEYEDVARDAVYRFVTEVRDDEVGLEVHRRQDGEDRRLAARELYDRSAVVEAWYPIEEDRFKSRSAFRKQALLSRPRVTDVSDDGRYLWVTLAHDGGEGHYGLGTLVRVDALTGEVKTFQPPALATSSLTHVTTAALAVWMGTLREAEAGAEPTLGLVRFDPVSGKIESFRPESSPLVGSIVTALEAEGDTLWIGTDEGICRYRIHQREWTCWRIIPRVWVLGQVPVSNRPGGSPRRRLHRGGYEIRWAEADSLEVITGDYLEGWVRLGPREPLPSPNHYADMHALATGGEAQVDSKLVYQEPGGSPERAALLRRIDLQKQPLRTADGWQRVKAYAGWIPAKDLRVEPELTPVQPD